MNSNSCSHPPSISPSSQSIKSNEEEKKSDEADESPFPHLPCYDLPDISQIWFDGKIQFKKDEFIMEDGEKFTVEGEWLNGVPHGICIFENE